MIYETQEQLDAALKEWQKVLQLQDWKVKASIVRGRDMFMEDSAAAVRWTFPKKMATIVLLDPLDYEPNRDFPQDHEKSLVHELLHLHYAGFDSTEPGSVELDLLEQSIEAISTALVELKRKGASESKGFSLGELIRKEETIRPASDSAYVSAGAGELS